MKKRIAVLTLVLSSYVCMAMAQTVQTRPDIPGGHEPPPQAYADCMGKQAGETVQHTTPEGKVTATCVDSPKGLVARPDQRPGPQLNVQPMQPLPFSRDGAH